MDPRDAPVRERLDRYLDLVEAWGLCPWAAPARRDGSLRIEVVHGRASLARASAIAAGWLASEIRIGLIVMPDPALDPGELRGIRDRLALEHPALAIADFHPDGGDPARADAAARLVHVLRRSPDPMLQLVPQRALAALAMPPPIAAPSAQAAMLAGSAALPGIDPRARIAEANLATVRERGLATLIAELAALRS
jgi:hypothetical protein